MNMTVKERLKAEWQKIMSLKGKTRREYIWDYYRFHIIATAFVVIMGGSLINDTIINPRPRSALTIAWMAGFELHETMDLISESLYPTIVYDPSSETVDALMFNLSGDPQHDSAQMQRFAAMTAARELDIAIAHLIVHDDGFQALGIAPTMMFKNIMPFLQAAGIEPQGGFVYCDNEERESIEAVAVSMEGSRLFPELGLTTENRYVAIVASSQRDEAVIDALRAIWEGT